MCEKPWPDSYISKLKRKGEERPTDPVSVSKGIPNLFRAQTLVSKPTNLKEKLTDSESRSSSSEIKKTDFNMINFKEK